MTQCNVKEFSKEKKCNMKDLLLVQLIFRDFKTSNILLDEEFNAKLSDFGLARQGPPEGTSHVSTAVSFFSFGYYLYNSNDHVG